MTQKVRNSNLELYRIITMLAIVAHHYVVNSGLMGGISCVKVIIPMNTITCMHLLQYSVSSLYAVVLII